MTSSEIGSTSGELPSQKSRICSINNIETDIGGWKKWQSLFYSDHAFEKTVISSNLGSGPHKCILNWQLQVKVLEKQTTVVHLTYYVLCVEEY